jgi:hypothetical protein
VFEEMRETEFALWLVARPGVHPKLQNNFALLIVGHEHDLRAIGELKLLPRQAKPL